MMPGLATSQCSLADVSTSCITKLLVSDELHFDESTSDSENSRLICQFDGWLYSTSSAGSLQVQTDICLTRGDCA